ncbi:16S rRNA (cytidine(1402)-2'-O)-methyltransferase [Candidatus Gottesmanbacteria bacterium]|nr:16S rRNA (cytidine(1402)-2'-O)-methyltransferase [Candidatus Gottesmanbacteria bacterium]
MGTLYIVATPIGNLEDITIRAIKTLFTVDYIACEDTRKTGQLLKTLKDKYKEALIHLEGVRMHSFKVEESAKRLISYYDEIEFKRVPEIIELLQNNKNVALVSDSGTPLISDPGFKLVRECIRRNIKVVSIPGPSSVIAALTSSGLPPNNFLFLGYLPPKKQKRINLLKGLQHFVIPSDPPVGGESRNLSADIHPTIIFFETPHRLKGSLEDLQEVFGNIEIVIARELTKIHEEVWRGKISTAIKYFGKAKGEIVILF